MCYCSQPVETRPSECHPCPGCRWEVRPSGWGHGREQPACCDWVRGRERSPRTGSMGGSLESSPASQVWRLPTRLCHPWSPPVRRIRSLCGLWASQDLQGTGVRFFRNPTSRLVPQGDSVGDTAGIAASALAVICPPTHAPSNEGIILDLGTRGVSSALPVRSWALEQAQSLVLSRLLGPWA